MYAQSSKSMCNEFVFPISLIHPKNNNDLDLPIAIRKGTRTCTQHPMSHFMTFNKFSMVHKSFLTQLRTIAILKTLSETLSNENWRQVMKVEMEVVEKNGTWEIVDFPKGKSVVSCKWVFHHQV